MSFGIIFQRNRGFLSNPCLFFTSAALFSASGYVKMERHNIYGGSMISIDDFRKVELRIGQVKAVEEHPNADRLYVISVEVGDKTKQLVAGIKGFYQREELLGKLVVEVDNLEPALLRGVESQGMLLAASDENGLAVITPERTIKPGSIVK